MLRFHIILLLIVTAGSYFWKKSAINSRFIVKNVRLESANQNINSTPLHVAFIVDGNGRWAESRSLPRLEGHRIGAGVSVEIVKRAFQLNVTYVTLYLFSTENWHRPRDEVDNIMVLLESYLKQFSSYLKENKIRLAAIGQLDRLPQSVRDVLDRAGYDPSQDQDTSSNRTGSDSGVNSESRTLCLALSYGGRDDIVRACRGVTESVLAGTITTSDIDARLFSTHTETGRLGIPDPDLILRTSGEFRLSNFLLWQSAYAEFFSVDKYCKFKYYCRTKTNVQY